MFEFTGQSCGVHKAGCSSQSRLATGGGSCLGEGLLETATCLKEERSVSFLGTGDGSILCCGVWRGSRVSTGGSGGARWVACLGTGLGKGLFEHASCLCIGAVDLREEVGGASLLEDSTCRLR